MPELPEVETIRRTLEGNIIGKTITKIEVLNLKSFHGEPFHAEGQKVLKTFRKAKMLGISLANDLTLLFHLKMSGQVIYQGEKKFVGGHPTTDMLGQMPNKSTRVVFNFNDGSVLFFNDQRKFGWVKLMNKESLNSDRFLTNLGPEPLEEGFNWQLLRDNLYKHKKTPVKVALLDQTVVAGVGNIYASEACFIAGVDPKRLIGELTDREFIKLHKGVVESLESGIKYGGSSKTHFVDAEGRKGVFLDFAYVYGRDKSPCKKCGTGVIKIKLGGRGTYYCSSCQS